MPKQDALSKSLKSERRIIGQAKGKKKKEK